MKSLGLVVMGFLLVSPASARAQSVKLADIVGTWVRPNCCDVKRGDTLYIQADSTYRFGIDCTGGCSQKSKFQHWNYLKGDTLSFAKSDPPFKTAKDTLDPCVRERRVGYCGEPGYKLTLKDQQVTLAALGNTGSWVNGTYKRIDAIKQTP